MKSETPRTDADVWLTRTEVDDPTTGWTVLYEAVVDADLARKLERELAAAQAQLVSNADELAAMRKQRDEAHGLIRRWRLNLVDVVEVGDYMDAMTSEARIGMNDADKRAFLEATRKEGGGA